MASLSSFPFSIEGTAEVSSSSKNRALATIGQRRPSKFVSLTNLRSWNDNLRRSIRAAARDSVGGEPEKRSDDAFQHSIEKTQQLLAVQTELLQQIVEKRKLVTSKKTGSSNAVERRGSTQDSQNTSPSNPDPRYITSSANGGLSNEPFPDQVYDKISGGSVKGPPPPTRTVLDSHKSTKNSSSDNSLLDSGSVVIAEETSTLPTSLSMSSDTITPENVLEESMADILLSDTPEDMKPPPLVGPNVMNVILVAAECSPFSKTGGLGDVAGSLPKALARRGHRVMVVVPKYGDYPEAQHIGVVKKYKVDGQDHEVSYFHAYIDGVDFVFIQNHMFHAVENNIYGGNRLDVLKRMVLFCKATVEVPWHVPCGGVCYGDGNLVFVANDWHTALLPVYLKAYYRDKGLMVFTRSVLVIHNIAHQGRGPVDEFSLLELPEHWLEHMRLYDPIGGEHLNVFTGGLKAADRIVTVSHGYVWELKTVEGGWGLHDIIRDNDWKLRGIVNGIDTKEWSPQHDVHLRSDGYTNYWVDTLETGKAQCKRALQNELGLPQKDDVPLIGFIGRLDSQKGVDLIAEALPWMMEQDVQLVMLGTGRPDLEQMLRHFEGQYHDRARGWVGFSAKTAHRITAGADILLMPSRFEPCGLNQLYAMNYGTVPVVHAVGGLRDTVQPFDPYEETGLGWAFDRAESGKLIEALGNCLLTYREYKESWKGLQRRGMTQDLSWDHAAEIYEQVLIAAKYQW